MDGMRHHATLVCKPCIQLKTTPREVSDEVSIRAARKLLALALRHVHGTVLARSWLQVPDCMLQPC